LDDLHIPVGVGGDTPVSDLASSGHVATRLRPAVA
jgi:hypothetical protein